MDFVQSARCAAAVETAGYYTRYNSVNCKLLPVFEVAIETIWSNLKHHRSNDVDGNNYYIHNNLWLES